MATIREYFDNDCNEYFSLHKSWSMTSNNGVKLPSVIARINQNFAANAKYWSFYIPPNVNIKAYIKTILNMQETKKCVLSKGGDDYEITESNFASTSNPESMSSLDLFFTNRVFLYIDTILSEEERNNIILQGRSANFLLIVRDQEHAQERSKVEKPFAFISHDSKDKDEIVRDLAAEIIKLKCPVWYDEYSLNVGDSLRQSIENGLKEAKNCIIILSPNFFSNEGWGKAEFDSIFTREILEKKNIMLPIWHNVTVKDVYDYSPRLADKVGLPTSLGVKDLAKQLVKEIKKSCI